MASKQQLKRLKNEYEDLLRGLEGNPFIYVAGTKGDPPFRYHIGYNLQGVTFDSITKQVSYMGKHAVRITLYKDFPKSPPQCDFETEIFHPNIPPSSNRIDLQKWWRPEKSLLDLVRRIGALLSYQEYDLTLPSDKEAAQWAMENESSLPLDAADLYCTEELGISGHGKTWSEDKTVCTYCRDPNPEGTCNNGHYVCSHCKRTCHYCENVTCLACPDNTCRQCIEKIRILRLQIAGKIKAGDIRSAMAIGEIALESFRNDRRLRKAVDRLHAVKELVGDTTELKRQKYFVGLAKTCDELRRLGFYNEMTARLEAEAADRIRDADNLVATGKELLQVKRTPQNALEHFSRALEIVADHPSAIKLVRETGKQINEAKKQLEIAKEYLSGHRYEPAMRAANKAAAMDIEVNSKAEALIERARKFKAVEPGRKKERVIRITTTIAASVLILVTGFLLRQQMHLGDKYQEVLDQTETLPTLEQKIQSLQAFVNAHGSDTFADDAKDRIWNMERRIQQRNFEAVVSEADTFIDRKDYEGAESIYETFLARYPDSVHGPELHKRIVDVLDLMNKRDDEKDYQALTKLSGKNFKQRIDAYNAYLSTYAKGKHRDEVGRLVVTTWQAYAADLRAEMNTEKTEEGWDRCVQLCDAFSENLSAPEWSADVKGLRHECLKRVRDEMDVASLVREVEARGDDFESAMALYGAYLEKHPDSSLTDEIKRRSDALSKALEDRKTWEGVLAYARSEEEDFRKRIDRVKAYLAENESGTYADAAGEELKALEQRHDAALWTETLQESEDLTKNIEERMASLENFIGRNLSGAFLASAGAKLKILRNERERRLWNEASRHSSESTATLSDRIAALNDFVSRCPSGDFADEAKAAIAKLKYLRAEEQRVRRQIVRMGGPYVYSKGIIVDRRTGLMWCAFDSYVELNRCLSYESAIRYVHGLRCGGYSDWRLPSAGELRRIYKSPPFFPTLSEGKWYWTSDQMGESVVPVVTTQRANESPVAEIESSIGCGSVRAVRHP